MIAPKPHLLQVYRTAAQTDSRKGFLRLDHNERIIPFPEEVVSRFADLLTPEAVMMYPEPALVYSMLASYLGVEREQVLMSSGSDLAIKSVFEVYISPGEEVVMHEPSYAMYSVYCELFQARRKVVSFGEGAKLNIEQFLDNITESTRMVVLENPNGFIGTAVSQRDVERVARKAHECDALLLVDEAYYLFNKATSQGLLAKYDNLILCRTFSKDFGIAGLRAGYLISRRENIENLGKVRPMHEVNSAAIAFVRAMLENHESIQTYISSVQKGLEMMKQAFSDMGLETSDSRTNFLVVKIPDHIDSSMLREALRQEGALVRRPFELSGNTWLRISAGSTEQLRPFVDNFRKTLKALQSTVS